MNRHAPRMPRSRAAQADVDSLQRGLEILRCFRAGEKSLRLADIVERTQIPRLSARKLLNTQAAQHFLRELPELQRFEPDVSCFVLGHAWRASLPILRVARPVMQALAESLGVDVLLALRLGIEMMIVESCSARGELLPGARSADIGAGNLVPLAQTALGRAWLWAQRPAIQGEVIERIRAEGDGNAPNAIPGIYRAFQDLAERGYCLSLGDWRQDRHAIATPLILGGGSEVFALSAAAADPRLNDAGFREKAAAALMDAAQRIKNEVPRAEAG